MFDDFRQLYWTRPGKPALALLGLWLVFAFIVQTFFSALNKIIVPVLGLPLGIYLAVQGSLIVFVVLVFWFSRKRT
jgi:putative solute:sodium symporter small subunit